MCDLDVLYLEVVRFEVNVWRWVVLVAMALELWENLVALPDCDPSIGQDQSQLVV